MDTLKIRDEMGVQSSVGWVSTIVGQLFDLFNIYILQFQIFENFEK
jgi:hypothetical protein